MIWKPRVDWRKRLATVELTRKATIIRPDVAQNWRSLGAMLLGLERHDEAVSTLKTAVRLFPELPDLHLMLSQAFHNVGSTPLALDVLGQAPAVPPDERRMTIYRLELLMHFSDHAAAARIAWDTLAIDPSNTTAIHALVRVLHKEGKSEQIVSICRNALQFRPGDPVARYELAVALTILGRLDDARKLIDISQYVIVSEIRPPEGYSGTTFEAELMKEIKSDPTLRPDPLRRSTRGGLQTLNSLPHTLGKALFALLERIQASVDDHLPTYALDPLGRPRPDQARLDAWAVVYSKEGRQLSHIHPSGWLSGVYYVSAPPPPEDAPSAGCLVLGAFEVPDIPITPPWDVKQIEAVPGRLILFPSHFPHATVPTVSEQERVCVSFDVVPVRF